MGISESFCAAECPLPSEAKMNGKKILIVDDEPDMIELIKMRLVANGYKVVDAKDGLEGLEKASKEEPDLILLDIKMAQMDGYSMLRGLRQDEKMKSIPVIILTSYEKMKDIFEMEGISDYIMKPFDNQDFLSRVAKALKREE